MVGEAGDPRRERDLGRGALAPVLLAEAHGGHPLADRLCTAARLLERRAREQQAELLPAEPRGDRARLTGRRERLGHREDDPVADQVPESVVDLAEVIEIDDHDRQRGAVPARGRHGLVHLRAEVGEVVEARLGVGPGAVLELRHEQGAVDQRDGPQREQCDGGPGVPEHRETGAGGRERQVERKPVRQLVERALKRGPAGEARDEHDQQVVEEREYHRGHRERRDRGRLGRQAAREDVRGGDDGVCRKARDQVVADVEGDLEPGQAPRGPARHEAADRQHGDRPRREHRGAPEEEREVRLERVVAGREDLEEIRPAAEHHADEQQGQIDVRARICRRGGDRGGRPGEYRREDQGLGLPRERGEVVGALFGHGPPVIFRPFQGPP